MFDPEEFDSALDDLELRLERLHLLFERFFAGSERTEPNEFRDEIDQQFAALLVNQRNLGALSRVRLTILHQRYDGYQKSWKRLANQASERAHPRSFAARDSVPASPIERASPGFSELTERSEGPPSAGRAPTSYSFSSVLPPRTPSSIPAPRKGSLTPPLGTCASAPEAPERLPEPSAPLAEPRAKASRTGQARPDSARTIRDFRAPFANEPGQTSPDLRPAFENPSAEQAAAKTQPRMPLPFSMDSSSTTPYLRLPDDHEFGLEISAEAAPPAPPQVSMERVREIHARLRASNTEPPSLERLAKRLSETEAKLRELHGDRPVTFDVILKNGKGVVKPIVH